MVDFNSIEWNCFGDSETILNYLIAKKQKEV